MTDQKSKMILCIEDEPEMIDLIRVILTRRGFEIRGANGGKEGIEIIRKEHPDLVLLDLMMPEMDGFEFLDELRRRPEWREIPVVVITSKDLTEEDRRRLNGGVARIIQKGTLSFDELLATIRVLAPAETYPKMLSRDVSSRSGLRPDPQGQHLVRSET